MNRAGKYELKSVRARSPSTRSSMIGRRLAAAKCAARLAHCLRQLWVPGCLALLFLAPATGCLFSAGKESTQAKAEDRAISTRIEQLLAREPQLKTADLRVYTANGIVELTGFVSSLAAKDRAGLVAASVAGVVQVHNDLLPPAQSGR